jgi:hypothetical protein
MPPLRRSGPLRRAPAVQNSVSAARAGAHAQSRDGADGARALPPPRSGAASAGGAGGARPGRRGGGRRGPGAARERASVASVAARNKEREHAQRRLTRAPLSLSLSWSSPSLLRLRYASPRRPCDRSVRRVPTAAAAAVCACAPDETASRLVWALRAVPTPMRPLRAVPAAADAGALAYALTAAAEGGREEGGGAENGQPRVPCRRARARAGARARRPHGHGCGRRASYRPCGACVARSALCAAIASRCKPIILTRIGAAAVMCQLLARESIATPRVARARARAPAPAPGPAAARMMDAEEEPAPRTTGRTVRCSAHRLALRGAIAALRRHCARSSRCDAPCCVCAASTAHPGAGASAHDARSRSGAGARGPCR